MAARLLAAFILIMSAHAAPRILVHGHRGARAMRPENTIPAFQYAIGIGVDPSRTLVISQVVLSFGIPFALVPLVMFTSRRSLMGVLVNQRATVVLASMVAGLIICLNVFLLGQTLFG